MALLRCSKEVEQFRLEVERYCREIGKKIAWEYGGSHVKVRDAETMRSICDSDGVPLTLPTSPGSQRWTAHARADFRRVGLLPRSQPSTPGSVDKSGRVLSLPERIGMALRPDLAPATRRAILREVGELIEAAAVTSEEAAA